MFDFQIYLKENSEERKQRKKIKIKRKNRFKVNKLFLYYFKYI